MELTAETKYQLLLQISHKIRDTLDLDEILNLLLDMIQPVLAYDAAGIFLLNQDLVDGRQRRPEQLIASVVWRGFDAGPPEADPMLTLGEGIIGHVIRTGQIVVLADVRQDARYVAGRQGTLSEVAVPIIKNERPIGALNLESDQPGAYGDNDVELLQFFADAAAIYGIFQPATGQFTYVNSDHNPPLLLRSAGELEQLKINGPGLSILKEVIYEIDQIRLAPGDLPMTLRCSSLNAELRRPVSGRSACLSRMIIVSSIS